MATIEMQTIPTINLGIGGGVASIQPIIGVGPVGPVGPLGPTGPAPNLAPGTVSTLGSGVSATASVSGTNPNYLINLGIPTGATGATGAQGLPGPGAAAWTAAQAVTVGSVRQAPDGSWIKSTAARTTGATFDAAEAAFWTAVLATAGTIEKVAADAAYATFDAQLSYGAVGNGVADDTTAIQNAITAAGAAVGTDPSGASARIGAVVILRPGYYLISAQLVVPNGVTVLGHGRMASRIVAAAAFPLNTALVRIGAGGSTTFAAGLKSLAVHCRDIAGSIGVLTSDGQEGCGLNDVRIRGYRDAGFRAKLGAAGSRPAENRLESCEFWGSSLGSNYGFDFDTCGGSHYVKNTTVLALSGAGVHTAAVRAKTASVSVENLHVESYKDGVFVDADGFVAARNIQGGNGVGPDATHAMVHVSTTGQGVFDAIRNGGGNTFYSEAYTRLIGVDYINHISVSPAPTASTRQNSVYGHLEVMSRVASVPATRARNIAAAATDLVSVIEDAAGTTKFGVYADGNLMVAGITGDTAWTTPTFVNSWINPGFAGYAPTGYRRDALKVVRLRGLISTGTTGTVAFTLPAGYSPVGGNQVFVCVTSGNFTRVDVGSDGTVLVNSAYTSYVALDTISFLAA